MAVAVVDLIGGGVTTAIEGTTVTSKGWSGSDISSGMASNGKANT